MRRRGGLALILALGLWLGTAPSAHADNDAYLVAQLDPKYREWLEEVGPLLRKEERKQFLALTKDYQRDGFIYRFWEARNPNPGSSFNAFKADWERRVAEVREEYGNINEDRARIKLLHGPPASVHPTNCGLASWRLEIWTYSTGERVTGGTILLFYQFNDSGTFHLWHRADGLKALIALFNPDANLMHDDFAMFSQWAERFCSAEAEYLVTTVARVLSEDDSHLIDSMFATPPPRDVEWLASFRGVSTDVPAGAEPLAARLEVKFPARDHGRAVMQGVVLVPTAAASPAELEGNRSYNFLLTGELLKGSQLVESFRYRFDLPATTVSGDTLPLAFERNVWAGDYVLILRVEDLHSHHNFRAEQPLTAPPPDSLPELALARRSPEVTAVLEAARAELRPGGPAAGPGGAPPAPGPSIAAAAPGSAVGASGAAAGTSPASAARAESAADAAAATASAAIHLVPPPGGQQTGGVRLEAQVSGTGIHKVAFFLDGKETLTRLHPPYTVELNLGEMPVTRQVRAVAVAADGRELAADTLVLNAPQQRFAVRLLEPRAGVAYRGQTVARAEVKVPDGSSLDRLEVFLDDQRVATLFQPPWVQVVPLPAGGSARFVRAVAYLTDGAAAEDLAVINSPDVVEKLDVRLVELYTSVFDRAGRPVGQLAPADFKVFDGGREQSLLRCEPVHDLPLHLLFAIDTSASMANSLPQVQKAALAFLHRTMTPKDRAALLTFSDSPVLRMPFTADVGALGGALAGLNAERGTALYDSLVYGLSYMRGAQHGQSALILFTDGGDHISHLSFDETLEYARRTGIALYVVGARISHLDLQIRARLAKLADDTGGRSFFIDSAAELDSVYASIEDELRSRYLLAYQPTTPPRQGEFRTVEVRVDGEGRRVKAIRGYYP